ncbi:elongation factor G [Haploplasma axanthum]|uniref:Elongation factor G n=1 Tax=Haploplasma axanthum TaxID=29552 RepID=A0A449BFC5_HAPAX|nr:elongation factor G [Haploplasma axanthum]VEU81142.1 Elongation factor G domain protein [Haploplasma axanthum]
MREYATNKIRNIAVVGHQGTGKTSLVEAILYATKAIEKKGEIEKKNTVSDYLLEEKNKMSSFSLSLIPVEWKDYKLNLLDVPGGDEFIGDLDQTLEVVKGAIIVIDATKGVEVGTERVWREIRKRHIPAVLFVNKMDQPNIKFDQCLEEIRTKLGKKAVPLTWPLGRDEKFDGFVNVVENKARIYDGVDSHDAPVWEDKKKVVDDLRTMIMESVAETSEELLDLFFETGSIPEEDMKKGLRIGIMNGELTPVLVGSAGKTVGVRTLLEMLVDYLPAPNELAPLIGIDINTKKEVNRRTTNEEPFSGYIFKTIVDPFLGTINLVKINSGTLRNGQEIINVDQNKTVKIANVFTMRGKEQISQDLFNAGDICAVAKLDFRTGETISDVKNPIKYKEVYTRTPVIYLAIHPKNRNDEDKISSALQKINFEDPTFVVTRNKETAQLLIGGQGITHLGYVLEKLKNLYKVDVDIMDQKISYRETIKKLVNGEGKHKKQSGGAGQYGHVFIRFEPTTSNFEFASEVVGGAVPKGYFPAVEKGLQETFEKGPLAGFPVINVKATLYDGSYHDVDSNEISFKLAAALAFKNAVLEANATILEPILKLDVTVKDEYVGDVMGDLNKRRGRILGMDQKEGYQIIQAEVPESEVTKYVIDLKAMTQGSGNFKREFLRYEEVPNHLIDKIILEYKK